MKRRVLVLAVVLWVVVIALGSVLTTLVIRRVGNDLTTGAPSGPTTSSQVYPAPLVSPTRPAQPRTPSRPRRPPGSPSPSTSRQPAASSTPVLVLPTPAADPRPSPGPPSGAPPKTPRPAPPTTTTGGASSTDGTWAGSAGRVTITCRQAQASLVSATPADGWRVEVGGRGPEEVEVTFQRGDAGDVQVRGACTGGGARFQVQGGD